MHSSFRGNFSKNNLRDTTLRLDGYGYGTCGNSQIDYGARDTSFNAPDDGCKLVLGLGPTPSAYSDEYSPSGGKNKRHTSIFSHGVSSKCDSVLKLGLSGDIDAVSSVLEFSASMQISSTGNKFAIPIVDEGSTSAKKSGGYMTRLIMAPRMENSEIFSLSVKSHSQLSSLSSEPSAASNYSMSAISEPGSAAISSDQRGSNTRRCNFDGCTRGARGVTGLCIGHGGGQRCQKLGCNKDAEGRTAYCKAHGGGKRCQHLGCTKSAEGKTEHCIAHGGGRRCGYQEGCNKAARGKSGLCIKHGGGKRCKVDGCSRSAEGQIGLCISHGGGRRCQFLSCNKGAQGSTMFCKAHGGGKRCVFAGCMKGAEGSTPLCKGHGGGKRCFYDGGGICPKSVHGGTDFCVAHGGGKRCTIPGCSKSARGKTDCCVKHGGGKRCKVLECGKSAQGSTDFCKAHGGGKRCNWGGDGKCEKFARGKSGLCAAHSSLVHGREMNKGGGMIGPGLFNGLVVRAGSTTGSSSGMSVILDSIETQAKRRRQMIPPGVLVPLSMKGLSSFYSKQGERSSRVEIGSSSDSRKAEFDFVVPEGRVHGGGLLSLLGGNLNTAINGGI